MAKVKSSYARLEQQHILFVILYYIAPLRPLSLCIVDGVSANVSLFWHPDVSFNINTSQGILFWFNGKV